MIDIRKIKRLIQLVEQSNISELEISEENSSVRICCSPNSSQLANTLSAENEDTSSNQVGLEYNKTIIASKDDKKNRTVIRSPIVGTFYLTPNPNAKPFIEVGQKMRAGDTLCIVEAMKMMNHIKTEKSGTVVSILAESGNPVEFDEPLIVLD
jgi:acetyl-CoA carboxylase biotin carboxyl carrier protein